MTLRNPEHFFESNDNGDDSFDESSASDDDVRDANATDPDADNLDYLDDDDDVGSLTSYVASKGSDGSNIIHPVFTDFGPQTLSQYLRTEIEKLRTSGGSTSPSVKGKEKAQPHPTSHLPPPSTPRAMRIAKRENVKNIRPQQSAGPPQPEPASKRFDQEEDEWWASLRVGENTRTLRRGTADTISVVSVPGQGAYTDDLDTHASLCDASNSRQPAKTPSGSSMRRSSRLARKGSSSQDPDPNEPDIVCSHGNLTLSPVAESASHDLEQHAPPSGHASASRRSHFEEHTKSKREAVRAVTADSPTTPEHLIGSLGRFVDKARPRKAPGRSGDWAIGPHTSSRLQHSSSTSVRGPNDRDDVRVGLAIGSSLSDKLLSLSSSVLTNEGDAIHCVPASFDYSQIVPESIPKSVVRKSLHAAQRQQSSQTVRVAWPERCQPPELHLAIERKGDKSREYPSRPTIESYPRILPETSLPILPDLFSRTASRRGRNGANSSSASTASALPRAKSLEDFNTDLWLGITKFLSTRDVRNLRLVSSVIADTLSSIQTRNVVVNFGQSMFDVGNSEWDSRRASLPRQSMFEKYGDNINQFGIAFEYDVIGLSGAKPKIIEKEQDAWFGKFTWPTENYPRYPALQVIEDLVDNNRPLLKDAFRYITKASELGLCIDNGHGWLEGPDISDMALLARRANNGSKIFGKTFAGDDVMDLFSRNEYFKWAQQNTINETIKHMIGKQASAPKEIRRFLHNTAVRDMESFKIQKQQHDFDPDSHVGGPAGTAAPPQVAGLPNAPLNWGQMNALPLPIPGNRQIRAGGNRRASPRKQLQWPLIFNGHNLAAEIGGSCSFVQHKTAHPMSAPLRPGMLTEAQAQWLMETTWAQRAFLSAYTTAILTNKHNFTGIHTLRISKLSSGLLPSLAQREFWGSLPGLQKLQMLISPDWRQEHIIGDRFFQTSMPIAPHKAAQRFTEFLKSFVIRIESLHSLSIGYVGGGEHAVGMFARNQHVLPAPIVDNPGDWLHESDNSEVRSPLTKFDHIRDLKFHNCWFSPRMLKDFMKQSRDTSLHSLTLDSVSMLTNHDPSIEQPLTTGGSNLRCHFEDIEWLHESLPTSAAWTQVLDDITPGTTLLERKYAAGLIDEMISPMPTKKFRGHVQKITLDSCGYVKISLPRGVNNTIFNQNSAVTHLVSSLDNGLRTRRERFNRSFSTTISELQQQTTGRASATRRSESDEHGSKRAMMSTSAPSGEVYPWLGTLTQCVHPIEQRVLEMAWNMEFGWPHNLERWAAVEDGYYEGGTGRFSGTITNEEQRSTQNQQES